MFLDTTEWLKNPYIKWIDKVNRFDKKKFAYLLILPSIQRRILHNVTMLWCFADEGKSSIMHHRVRTNTCFNKNIDSNLPS